MGDILVLDDVLDAGVMIKRILERKGHQVAVFTEEEAALGHVRTHPVEVAILDIRLKKMSGVDMLEELKKCQAPYPGNHADRLSHPGNGAPVQGTGRL